MSKPLKHPNVLTVRISEEIRSLLVEMAFMLDISVSGLIRDAICEYAQRRGFEPPERTEPMGFQRRHKKRPLN